MRVKELIKKFLKIVFHIEHPRLFLHQIKFKLLLLLEHPLLSSPSLFSDLENCMVRVRISNRCNCKCKFCALRCSDSPNVDMDPVWIHDYCRPLYEKAQLIVFTHGEFLMAPGAYELFQKTAKNYPQATIATESNGIGFDSKWQQLAADNLFRTSFSLNAVSEDAFLNGVWAKGAPGGQNAYRLSRQNIQDFIRLLEQKERICFAPNFAMVISSETMHEAIDFIRLSLKMKAGSVQFYFEVSESPVEQQFFLKPELHNVLVEIEKICCMLKNHFQIKYDLYIPWGEAKAAREEVSEISADAIQKQYADIFKLAENRSIIKEHEEREKIRKSLGKKSFTFEEDSNIYLRTIDIDGKKVCSAAWKQLDLSPDGSIQFCGWMKKPLLNIKDYIQDEAVDWEKLFNAPVIRHVRRKFLNHNYDICAKCCPVIPLTKNPEQEEKSI